MVDIVSRRCREPGCGRRPLYNMDGLRPVCWLQHKLPGMIDVVSTRCQEPVRAAVAFYQRGLGGLSPSLSLSLE